MGEGLVYEECEGHDVCAVFREENAREREECGCWRLLYAVACVSGESFSGLLDGTIVCCMM